MGCATVTEKGLRGVRYSDRGDELRRMGPGDSRATGAGFTKGWQGLHVQG